jgi:transposase
MRKLEVLNAERLSRALRREVRRSTEIRLLHRLHCVLMIAHGFSCYRVARCFGENPRTLERWVHLWNEGGAQRLHDKPHPGRLARLNVQQRQLLMLYLEERPSSWGLRAQAWTGPVLRDFLRGRMDVSLSVRQCQRLLPLLRRRRDPPAGAARANGRSCASNR